MKKLCYIPHFGDIFYESPAEYYDASIKRNGVYLDFDISFSGEPVALSQMESMQKMMDELDAADEKLMRYLREQAAEENGGIVGNYTSRLIKELPPENMAALIAPENPDPPHLQVLRQMNLVRLGFIPEDDFQFAIFDYSIDIFLTRTVITIYVNEKGDILDSMIIK